MVFRLAKYGFLSREIYPHRLSECDREICFEALKLYLFISHCLSRFDDSDTMAIRARKYSILVKSSFNH